MAAAETQALFQQLTILLALATASHFLFRRWHLPMIIGEIAVGILLGPSVVGNAALGSYRYLFDPAVVRTLAVLGSIFLLFLIGLDFDFRSVYTRKNVAVASGGVVLPLLLGFATALYLVPVASIGANGTQFTMALFVGATLTATSVAITAAVLFELNLLKDRVAQTILGAAVVDDVLGLIVLSVVVGTAAGRVSFVDLVILVTEAVGFLVVGMAIGIYVLRRLVARIHVEGNTLGVPFGGFPSRWRLRSSSPSRQSRSDCPRSSAHSSREVCSRTRPSRRTSRKPPDRSRRSSRRSFSCPSASRWTSPRWRLSSA